MNKTEQPDITKPFTHIIVGTLLAVSILFCRYSKFSFTFF